jgi:hypothetical protein
MAQAAPALNALMPVQTTNRGRARKEQSQKPHP